MGSQGCAHKPAHSIHELEQTALLRDQSGHGACMRGEELRGALRNLSTRFKAVALPEDGRYVNEPAVTNEHGVMFVPPATEKMTRLAKVLGITIAVASIALLIYQQTRSKRTHVNGVSKKLDVQYH